MIPLRIWSNFKPVIADPESLRKFVGGHELIIGAPSGPDPRLENADVAFGQPDPKQVISLQKLKLVHLNTAGYTRYDNDDVRRALRERGGMLTTSSGVFDEPCAQHALSMMLCLARKLPQAIDNQKTSRTWPAEKLRGTSQLLTGQTALLVGFGAIAKRLAELLAPFRMNLIGFRRHPKGNESIRCVSTEQLDEWLPQADHVIDILPASSSTEQFFNADRLSKLKPTAIFYNIGRGDTVDQTALRTMLETNSLAAAYLDVMTPEPLPPHDPLWTTPNCFITPHTAGGHTNETERVIQHFVENLKRLERNESLFDRVV